MGIEGSTNTPDEFDDRATGASEWDFADKRGLDADEREGTAAEREQRLRRLSENAQRRRAGERREEATIQREMDATKRMNLD